MKRYPPSEAAEESPSPEGRVDRLERQGLLRRARVPKTAELFRQPRPTARKGGSILQALLDERWGDQLGPGTGAPDMATPSAASDPVP